tara:strand:+ start:7478 stop:8578 length:1101 start_codon:yes stop_codon:yes gene_type:complete
MAKLKTVLFVIPDFGGGGAQRVLSVLLNNLDRNSYVPKLLLIKKNGKTDYLKDLKNDIEVLNLNIRTSLKFSALTFVIKLLYYLRVNQIDVLFMGAGTQNAFFSAFLPFVPKRIKTIARESNLPSIFERFKTIKWIYKNSYKNYDHIITQSNDMSFDLIQNFNIPPEKIIKINNPVDNIYIQKLKSENNVTLKKDKINLLCAGRLNYQKGFDLLISGLEDFLKIEDNIHLTILGEGEDKIKLEKLVKKEGLQEKITFLGSVDNPYSYMSKADLFVLGSRFEGFPNVLLEALTCGCPVLSNLCPGGIDEIIIEGYNGRTFKYELNNLLEQLDKCLNEKYNREVISNDCIQRFGVQNIIKQYNNLLNS